VYLHILTTLNSAGEKAVSFGNISQLSGLAPATLAQRFGSVDKMLRMALLDEWARLGVALATAEDEALVSSKGAQALLKVLPSPSVQVMTCTLRDPVLAEAAGKWRALVEAALAARRGGGTKGREAATLIFAAWQGRQFWDGAGGKGFRLSDLLRTLS
jgi:hypothetical protein